MNRISWVKQIYDYIEHYYWQPQHIGKITPKGKGGRENLSKFREYIRTKEVPLNALFNLTFNLLPQEFKQDILSGFSGSYFREVSVLDENLIVDDDNTLQPDVTILTAKNKLFIELKVDAYLTVNQLYKYILGLAQWDVDKKPILFLLTKKSLPKQWVFKERSLIFKKGNLSELLTFLRRNNIPKRLGSTEVVQYHEKMGEVINKLELGHMLWKEIYQVFKGFTSKDTCQNNETLQILINDFIKDLESRFDL